MTYKELAEFCYWDVGADAIETALDQEGFSVGTAMSKPPISEKNRNLRLKFTLEHRGWTYHNWCKFFWSDETWVKHGRYQKTHVLRRAGKEWHEDCVEEKIQRKKGWMFWGSFDGNTKGPGSFFLGEELGHNWEGDI
jgi:hypothetical protein